MASRSAAFIAAVLLLAVVVQGQGIPSSAECQNRVNSIGQTGLLSQLSSCQGGPSPQCCSQAQGLVGFPGSGQLAGCLCNADVLEATLAGIESNQLARNAGVTRASVQAVFDSCNIPTAARAGSCPGGGSVAVSAPGTTVNVGGSPAPSSPAAGGASSPAPSSPAVSVQAPGANVQVGGGSPAPSTPARSTASAPAPAPAAAYGKHGHKGWQHPFLTHWAASASAPAPAPAPAPAASQGWFGHHHKWGRKLFQVDVTAPGTTVAVSDATASTGTTVDVTAPGTTVAVGGSPAPAPASDEEDEDMEASPAPASPAPASSSPAPPSPAVASVTAASPALAPVAPTVPTPAPPAAAAAHPCYHMHGCHVAAAHSKMAAAHQAYAQHAQSKIAAYHAAHQAAQQHVADTVAQMHQAHQAKAASG